MINCNRNNKNVQCGFLLIEVTIALLLSVALSSVLLQYVGMLITWQREVERRDTILNEMQSMISRALIVPKVTAASQKKPWGVLAQSVVSEAVVCARFPFPLTKPLRSFSLITVNGSWIDTQKDPHRFILAAGRCG